MGCQSGILHSWGQGVQWKYIEIRSLQNGGGEPLWLFSKDHRARIPQDHLGCVPSRSVFNLHLKLSRKSTAEDRIS